MKKFFSLICVLIMVFSLSVAAGATEMNAKGEETADVKVHVNPLVNTGVVYSIVIEWPDLTFDYTKGQQGEWDPDIHDFAETTGARWTNSSNTVTITNHSNDGIKYKAAYTNTVDLYNEKITLTPDGVGDIGTGISIASAVGTTVPNAPKASFTIAVNEGVEPVHDNGLTIGSLKITIF